MTALTNNRKAFTSTMNDLTLSEIIYPELKTTSRLNYTGTNFHIWKTKLDFVLKDNKVNYVLTEPKPGAKDNLADVARHDKWVDDDFKARRIILGTLHGNLSITYREHETAKSLMDALTMYFTRPSAAKRLRLVRRFKDHRMQEGTSINQHIIEMNAMAKELELEGMNLPKEFHSVALMETLPESWEDVVTAITMNLGGDEEALGVDNICTKLMNAGDLKELLRMGRDEEESSSRDGSRGGFNGKCYTCGEFGHRKSDCPN